MAYRLIGPLSIRRLQNETLGSFSPLYCGCCRGHGTKSSKRIERNYRTNNHDLSYVHMSSNFNFLSHDNKSTAYYKTKNLIQDNFKLVHPLVSVRFYHLSPRHYEKDKSVVEKAVEILKGKPVVREDTPSKETVKETAVEKPKTSIMQTIRVHAKFYKDGFVLFFKELRIACSYLFKFIVKGEPLSRRELKQLSRTSADVFRMIPYLIFLIIPFFEFLIPVYLKLFPNALPSTFGRNEKKSDVILKEQLKRKQEMGKFLQETMEKTALERKKKDGPSMVKEFTDFMGKVRQDGITVSSHEILHFSTLFEDEITLDSLSRRQLQALCRVLGIIPIGTDQMLRFQLEVKLRRLLVDDKMIIKEGIDSLTVQELQQANRARGMRAMGVDEARLRFQLQQWLDLHVIHKVPTSLLLLSRALYLPEELSQVEQLQKTISSLSKAATDEATMKIAEISGEKIDPGTKMEVLNYEQEIIDKETKDKKEAEEKKKQEQIQQEEEKAEAIAARVAMESEELKDYAPEILAKTVEEFKEEDTKEELSTDELKEIESAIETIAIEKKFNIDEEMLQDLKEDVDEYKEDLEDLKSVILATGGEEEDIKESKSAKRLGKRVNKLVRQLDEKITELHQESIAINKEIDVKQKKLTREDLIEDEAMRDEMMQKISEKKGLVISKNDMLLALRRLQKVPNEERVQKIVQVLDEDRDGQIDASHVLKVIKLLGRDNIKLESAQVTDLIDLCKKEMLIEEEEKQKERVEKEQQKEKEMKEQKEKVEEEQNGRKRQEEKIEQQEK